MGNIFNLENTAILYNISTSVGTFISFVAIILSVLLSKEQYKISQYANRKKVYDFLKDFKDNYTALEKEDRSFNIALNIFLDDEKVKLQLKE